ncbi:hypothetical protein GCM10009743_29900 [Kribbella swartbergensis]
MKAYRALWLSLVAPLGLLALICAAAASSVWTVVVVFLLATLTLVGVSANLQAIGTTGRPHSPVSLSKSFGHGIAGGGTAVCLFGFGHIAGVSGIALVGLMVASSPTAVRLFRGPATRHHEPRREHGRLPSDQPATSPCGQERLFDDMTNAELCMAWRRSFIDLLDASSPADVASVAAYREQLLDELEARSPGGFAEWMACGARAASDPSKYLCHGSDAGRLTGDGNDS